MKAWFTSPTGAITLTVVIATGAGLALLSTLAAQGLSARAIAASLLILCFVVFIFGGALYTGRAMWKWPSGQTPAYLRWERGFVLLALLVNVLGVALLEGLLHDAGEAVISRLAMVIYLISAVVLVVAETVYLNSREWVYPQIVFYVVLAFLAQAAFGASLLQTGLVAGWVGWVTIIWNLAWLLIMLIFSPQNIYFPVLHHVAPLLIGIALLAQG
jgi:hypothetical protein